MTMKTAYRIRIAPDRGDRTYIVRADSGRVDYMSESGVPLALSNLVGWAAAELRFQLEDAKDGKGALARVDKVLTVQWSGNPTMQPKLELVSSNHADMVNGLA
jgi:hypothetical protein